MGNPVGPNQMLWLAHVYINNEMFLFILQKTCVSFSLFLSHAVTLHCLRTKHILAVRAHHGGGHAVHVVRVEVALPIVWLHDSSQTTIQSHVSLSIRGEDQKVGRTGAPADLLLVSTKPHEQ